jgi:hypothetical protein
MVSLWIIINKNINCQSYLIISRDTRTLLGTHASLDTYLQFFITCPSQPSCFWYKCTLKVKVILRPTVSWPVHLGVGHPSGIRDQFFFLLKIFFRQSRVCYSIGPSLMRRWVCNLLLLLVLASAVPRDSRPYFIAPILETISRTRSSGTEWPRYTSGHWVLLPSILTIRRATVEVFYPASTRKAYIQKPSQCL